MIRENERGFFKSAQKIIFNPRSWFLASIFGAGLCGVDILNGVKPHSTDDTCRQGNVLENVYRPQRLHVFSPCMRAKGTVIASLPNEEDGDWDIVIWPDPGSFGLLDLGNYRLAGGLMVEVIPPDQDSLHLPKIGERIAVTGAFVKDISNGWNEIHPTWGLYILSNSPLPESFTDGVRGAIPRLEELFYKLPRP